jgi:cytosine/adenosine deaminase-related metal-dependent hydrolase
VQRLVRRWDGAADGRLRVALSPRCPRGVTDELWDKLIALANAAGLVMHTHVDESKPLTEYHETTPEGRDMEMLARLGALTERLVMAHCVWPNEKELDLLAPSGASVCHCPSANLKLASGVARIPAYLERGINVALGADGAPCNNNLDGFHEMRLAALIHKPTFGPKVLPSTTVLRMATMGGAKALGIADEIGSLEPGKLADVVVLWPRRIRSAPSAGSDPISDIVYSRGSQDVRTVLVGGQVVVRDGLLQTGDEEEIMRTAEEQRATILGRARLPIGQVVA